VIGWGLRVFGPPLRRVFEWGRQVFEWGLRVFGPLLERLVQVRFIQTGVVLAAQTFMALFPLLIATIAILPSKLGTSVSNTLRTRIGLSGDSSHVVSQLVDSRSQLQNSLTAIGVLLVFFSATSFTRALQRVYQTAWELPKLGFKGSVRGLVWLLGLVCYLALLAFGIRLVTGVPKAGGLLGSLLGIVGAILLWWWTPYLLLGGRVRPRALLPSTMLTAIGLLILGKVSSVYLPRTIRAEQRRFGALGAVFAIQSWLVVLACTVVGTAVLGAVLAQSAGPLGTWIRGTADPLGWRKRADPTKPTDSTKPTGSDKPTEPGEPTDSGVPTEPGDGEPTAPDKT
jgi:membrane protein